MYAEHCHVPWQALTKPVSVLKKHLTAQLVTPVRMAQVTIEYVECHADCGKAPVVMIGEDEYTQITPDKADELVDLMKRSEL